MAGRRGLRGLVPVIQGVTFMAETLIAIDPVSAERLKA
jgi:hypothetical protein